MPSVDPNVGTISCPGCGARYSFPPSMAGKRGRCVACGATFIASLPAMAERADVATPVVDEPQYIGVECRVCQTRMYGRADQVGQKLKCPDCGARTEVPPPPKPKPKNIPAALEGEQYELWDADEQPLPSALIAAQPQYIAVVCRQCDTLMYAGLDQVGQTITCPDCGKKHTVPPPLKPKPVRGVLASVAETPVLDPAAAPGERPVIVPSSHQMLYEQEREAELAAVTEKERRTGKKVLDARGRPIMPRWPLINGVLAFLFHEGTRVRWFALSLGLTLAGGILLEGIVSWATWKPVAWDFEGGMQAMAGLAQMLIGTVLSMIWLAAASSIFLVIVAESSEGNDRVRGWPAVNFIESMADMLQVVVAVLFSAAPGWAIGQFVAGDPLELLLWTAGSMLLCFPIIYLSQASVGSSWALLDKKVAAGMLRCPFSVLLLYVESTLLLSLCAAVIGWSASIHHLLVMAFTPVYLGAALLYARLLGRLGWRLAEATAVAA